MCKTPYFKMTGVNAVHSFFFINILADKWAMSPRKEIMAKPVALSPKMTTFRTMRLEGLVQRNLKDIDNPFNSPF